MHKAGHRKHFTFLILKHCGLKVKSGGRLFWFVFFYVPVMSFSYKG